MGDDDCWVSVGTAVLGGDLLHRIDKSSEVFGMLGGFQLCVWGGFWAGVLRALPDRKH